MPLAFRQNNFWRIPVVFWYADKTFILLSSLYWFVILHQRDPEKEMKISQKQTQNQCWQIVGFIFVLFLLEQQQQKPNQVYIYLFIIDLACLVLRI